MTNCNRKQEGISASDLADVFCYNPGVDGCLPCPNCETTKYLKRHLSSLPCNSIDCRKCGLEGPNTGDGAGECESEWNKFVKEYRGKND